MCFTSHIITSGQFLWLVVTEKSHFIASTINRVTVFIMTINLLTVIAVRQITAFFPPIRGRAFG